MVPMRTLILALLLLLPLATKISLLNGIADASPAFIADRTPDATNDTNTDIDDEQLRVKFAPLVFIVLILGFHSMTSRCADNLRMGREDLSPRPGQELGVVLRI